MHTIPVAINGRIQPSSTHPAGFFLPRGRVLRVSLALLFVGLAANLAPVSAAGLQFAGVVVRHDGGRLSYGYVGFSEPEITGVELLRRTGLAVVTARFGGLGEGVCSIDETGCPASECRRRVCQGPSDADPFWQYFRQTSPGDWQPMALGASATKVRNGDLDGWSWTPRAAELPALTLDSVARLAGFDGSSFAGVAPGQPGAALHREQAPELADRQSSAAILTGAALLSIAALAVGWLLLRRRRPTGAV